MDDHQIKILIEKIKKQDYEIGKYLEKNIRFEADGIIYTGDKVNEILSKFVIEN